MLFCHEQKQLLAVLCAYYSAFHWTSTLYSDKDYFCVLGEMFCWCMYEITQIDDGLCD
jgi:hypothetical protein